MAETFHGTPCRRAGHTLRYRNGGGCVTCIKERSLSRAPAPPEARRRYNIKYRTRIDPSYKPRVPKTDAERAAAREAANARRRAARAADPTYRERASAYQRDYKARDPEKVTVRARTWHRRNPHVRKAAKQTRRARSYQAPGFHRGVDLVITLIRQSGRCSYCGATDDLHLDHIIPLSRGGSNWPWNLQYLCAWHNVSKGARTDREYRELAGLPILEPVSVTMWRRVFAILDLPFPEPF